jgi:hypothetical protein
MAGLVPAIPANTGTAMDGRDKPGHDGQWAAMARRHGGRPGGHDYVATSSCRTEDRC